MYAVLFCEEAFESARKVGSMAEFDAFDAGVSAAAGAYGAGSWSVYLLPRDLEAMRAERPHHPREIEKAIAATGGA